MMRRMHVPWTRNARFATACALLLIVVGGSPAIGESHGEQTIVGDVSIEEQNDDGDVISVSIYDNNWGAVIVSPADKGRELLAYIGAVVEAIGEIQDSEDGGYVIAVKSYRVVEDVDPDAYEEEDE